MIRDCHPLEIALPDGARALHVPGSRPARYAIDGRETAISTAIPSDLALSGWRWFGSFLSDGEIGIFTGTYGVEGAFEQARIHMALRANYAPQPMQLELFERAA